MRRIRFVALGIVSFVVSIFGALLAPGTFLNRALSAALCTVFSLNSAVCTASLVQSSERVVAATPPAVERSIADISGYLQAQRDPSEFGDSPSAPTPGSNPQAPPFPQDPGPNFPVRPEFDNPFDDAAADAANDIAAKLGCDKNQKAPIYAVYVNGVNTPRNVYGQDKVIINSLLKDALGEKVSLSFDAYNGVGRVRWEGVPAGDFLESAIQSNTSLNMVDGSILVSQVIAQIKRIEKIHEDFAKTADCDCHVLKPKYLLIGHSQGNFFVEDIALGLEEKLKERTSILSIASFTSYEKVRKEGKVKFEYLLRPDDFPLIVMKYVRDVESRAENFSEQQQPGAQIALGVAQRFLALAKNIYTPGGTNVSALNDHPLLNKKGLGISDLFKEENFVLMLDAHLIENYIGNPTKGTGAVTFPSFDSMKKDEKRRQPMYESKVLESYNKAKGFLTKIADYPSKEYPKDAKVCSPTAEQPPQPQQTAQQPNLTRRPCRVPKEFFKDKRVVAGIRMDDYICVIREPVITDGGIVDGVTACGTCDIWGNFGLLPQKSSCNSRAIDSDRSNQVPTCPSNWYGGN